MGLGVLIALGAGPGMARSALARKVTLKLATLAPEGSTWWNVLKEADQRMRELSGGELRLRIYAGGVAGDEPDVVRKMRVGQLHGAAISSVGMAEVQPELLALQAPGLFASWEELDAVRDRMGGALAALLAKKGFSVLVWGDAGFNRVFSNARVKVPAELAQTKAWCWTQDGTYQAWYSSAGVKPVSLGVPEVLPGLQTGLVNAFSVPPLVAVSLQWFNRTKFMLDYPISVTIGAVLLTERALAKLSDAQQEILKRVAAELGPKVSRLVRADNLKAVDAIRSAGITVTTPDPSTVANWQKLAIRAQDEAAGTVYSKQMLASIRKTLSEVRAEQ